MSTRDKKRPDFKEITTQKKPKVGFLRSGKMALAKEQRRKEDRERAAAAKIKKTK